ARLEPIAGAASALPFFSGGFLGALAYELGPPEEELDLPADPLALARVVGGLYTDFLLRDHIAGETWLCLGEDPGDGRAPVAERRDAILSALSEEHAPAATPDPTRGSLDRRVSPEEHRARIERVREEIARGEIYQANLTYRSSAVVRADAVELYRRLRAAHPGPYAGYLDAGEFQILSGSPELLLEFEPATPERPARGKTRPIKGTAPRAAEPRRDAALAAELLASEKDRAELAMIVDLERNDLGRRALPGAVRAELPFRLESFATVHHLMSDVEADIDPRYDGLDVLAALFPGGSVTGAPKLRAMEVIAELEREGRGFFYGSMLAVDTLGRVHANLLIRTLVRIGRAEAASADVHFRVGGGITHASVAAEEEREAGWKGEALARLLGGEALTAPEATR
ncbi:MAG TPA: anthranilate synthase component I family protein, partial [Planctomycetes bacterium]|nr:anthranilate synthase component I family protein [Planctomycetota bacterium]